SFLSLFFFFYLLRDHRHLHSFPTRRSSDLSRDQCRLPASLVEGFVGLGLIGLVEPGVQRDRLDVQLLEQPGKHQGGAAVVEVDQDRKSTRLNSSHVSISYAVFCLKKKKNN